MQMPLRVGIIPLAPHHSQFRALVASSASRLWSSCRLASLRVSLLVCFFCAVSCDWSFPPGLFDAARACCQTFVSGSVFQNRSGGERGGPLPLRPRPPASAPHPAVLLLQSRSGFLVRRHLESCLVHRPWPSWERGRIGDPGGVRRRRRGRGRRSGRTRPCRRCCPWRNEETGIV